MKTFVQPGESIELTAPGGGVTSGVGVQIGELLVIATVTLSAADVTAGRDRFNGLVEGVITHAKAPSQAWAEGARVYWDEANKRFTTSAAGNLFAGYATAAVAGGASDTTGTILLARGLAQEDT
jgi:predicted RecA/RadA family phage recombinase